MRRSLGICNACADRYETAHALAIGELDGTDVRFTDASLAPPTATTSTSNEGIGSLFQSWIWPSGADSPPLSSNCCLAMLFAMVWNTASTFSPVLALDKKQGES